MDAGIKLNVKRLKIELITVQIKCRFFKVSTYKLAYLKAHYILYVFLS